MCVAHTDLNRYDCRNIEEGMDAYHIQYCIRNVCTMRYRTCTFLYHVLLFGLHVTCSYKPANQAWVLHGMDLAKHSQVNVWPFDYQHVHKFAIHTLASDGEFLDAINHFFWNKHNGVAMELGALDGVKGSETKHLEVRVHPLLILNALSMFISYLDGIDYWLKRTQYTRMD